MKIYQMTNHTASQMMGYVLVTKKNQIIVIDGGCTEDSEELRRILDSENRHVDVWLLTQPHYDHNSALIEIIKKPSGIVVDHIYYSFLPNEWGVHEPAFHKNIVDINASLSQSIWPVHNLNNGQQIPLDGVIIDVLAISNPDITVNAFNNSSCVFRIQEDDFSFLVLGDLGAEAGERLLSQVGDRVRSTAVQMAHHGQQGVMENVYRTIAPKYAFWPTPDWLWSNTADAMKPGQGPWKTLETRAWMDTLNTVNITSFEHTVIFDTETTMVTDFN